MIKLGRKADIIYVQDPVSVGLPATLANLILKKKLFLKIVGDYAWEQQCQKPNAQCPALDLFYPFQKERYPFKIKLLQKIQNWVAKKTDKIIVPSFYLRNILTQGWKINENKIRVIYNALNVEESGIMNKESRIKEKFKILSVGRLVSWKGFTTLMLIMDDLPNAELEIIGHGPDEDSIRFRAGQKFNIKVSGKLPHNEVLQKMKKSDLFILNSAYEGLSHVILEAMACDLPIMASRAGGNAELLGETEERGYLFDYNTLSDIKTKIDYIISHQEEAKEKAKKAREYVAGLSEEKMINKLEIEFKENLQ